MNFQIIEGQNNNLDDVSEFIELLNENLEFFDRGRSVYVSRSPGRLDVMGGIADYSGSHVLQMPTSEATLVAFQKSADDSISIMSLSDSKLEFDFPISKLLSDGKPIDYARLREFFNSNDSNHWASYVVGVFLVLMREKGIEINTGCRILISSKIPVGKGVSSSAALEVATMKAVISALQISIEPRDLALLCQKVENLVVGAACGVMDQMSVVFGEENRLLSFVCQPAEIIETIEIPDEIGFWGIDSGVRHSVAGADYPSVRIGAFMGYRMIAELEKLPFHEGTPVKIQDEKWGGFLCNITPKEFEEKYSSFLPETIRGDEFLNLYRGTTDSVTTINPNQIYSVKIPTKHPIYENDRVKRFGDLLKAKPIDLEKLGELMYQAHESYAACGLCESGTNRLVEMVKESSLYGAKITGGGSGGTVAILGLKSDENELKAIAKQYSNETGRQAHVFAGSSIGNKDFGFLKLAAM